MWKYQNFVVFLHPRSLAQVRFCVSRKSNMQETKQYLALWDKCMKLVREAIPADQFDTYFSPTQCIGFSNGLIQLSVPSEFFIEQYEERFYEILNRAVIETYGAGVSIEYTLCLVKDDPESQVTHTGTRQYSDVKIETSKNKKRGKNNNTEYKTPYDEVQYADVPSQLNPAYSFGNYCVGTSNKLVYTIAEAIASHPEQRQFNPFFLYGNTGVGKTHLIQAIGIAVKDRLPHARVLYTTSRIFENQYGYAVAKDTVNDFINFYLGIDVLLIDDIQELAGKTGTQKAFYPIFNFLHQKDKKLIMTSDRPPVQLDGMMDRLQNRFKSGITEELPRPDRQLRQDILLQKARAAGVVLPEEVVDFIADNVTDSVRELEGILITLITRATILNRELSVDLARNVLQTSVKVATRKINFDMIVEAVAEAYHINPDVIFSKLRIRDIADARQVIMYIASKHTDLSLKSIAMKLGRTHPTVHYGINAIADRLEHEHELSQLIDGVVKTLKKS